MVERSRYRKGISTIDRTIIRNTSLTLTLTLFPLFFLLWTRPLIRIHSKDDFFTNSIITMYHYYHQGIRLTPDRKDRTLNQSFFILPSFPSLLPLVTATVYTEDRDSITATDIDIYPDAYIDREEEEQTQGQNSDQEQYTDRGIPELQWDNMLQLQTIPKFEQHLNYDDQQHAQQSMQQDIENGRKLNLYEYDRIERQKEGAKEGEGDEEFLLKGDKEDTGNPLGNVRYDTVGDTYIGREDTIGHTYLDIGDTIGDTYLDTGDTTGEVIEIVNRFTNPKIGTTTTQYFSLENLASYESLTQEMQSHILPTYDATGQASTDGQHVFKTEMIHVNKRTEPAHFGSVKFLSSLFGTGGIVLSLIQYFHDGTKDLAVINDSFYVQQEYDGVFELTTVQELIRFILYGCSRGAETYFNSRPIVGQKVTPMPRWTTYGHYKARRHGGSAYIYTKDDKKCALIVCQTNDKRDTKTNFRVNTDEYCFPYPNEDDPNYFHTFHVENHDLTSRVHKGFLYSYINLKYTTSLMNDWHHLQDEGVCEPERSYMSGFSLGAATAQIMALDGWRGKAVTFGTPKFLAGDIPDKIFGDYSGCRIDLYADPIPHGPCLNDQYLCSYDSIPYRHVGMTSIINRQTVEDQIQFVRNLDTVQKNEHMKQILNLQPTNSTVKNQFTNINDAWLSSTKGKGISSSPSVVSSSTSSSTQSTTSNLRTRFSSFSSSSKSESEKSNLKETKQYKNDNSNSDNNYHRQNLEMVNTNEEDRNTNSFVDIDLDNNNLMLELQNTAEHAHENINHDYYHFEFEPKDWADEYLGCSLCDFVVHNSVLYMSTFDVACTNSETACICDGTIDHNHVSRNDPSKYVEVHEKRYAPRNDEEKEKMFLKEWDNHFNTEDRWKSKEGSNSKRR